MTPIPLAEVHDPERHGGKAVSLGAAIRAGLPVPDGVALGVDLVRAVGADPGRCGVLAPHLAPLLVGSPVAVRSSAIGEDSSTASFAGQHITRLNVCGLAAVLEAVREVHASARTPSALAYRERMGIPGPPRIAVVVQAMIVPVCAGVLFTRNPLDGTDERVIEASWGLGEAVVSGAVTPDRWHMRRGGHVVSFRPGHKDIEIRVAASGGTVESAVPAERAARPCLSPEHLAQLEGLAHACERHFGHPGDIEWALHGDRVHLLQCRPVTRHVRPASG